MNIEGALTNEEFHHTLGTAIADRRQGRQVDVGVKVRGLDY